ncbi:MAG: preprotein translocase subunit SecE [Pseudomonadota bacterium]
MKNPVDFVNEVRAEGSKVVWPNRREAGLTTVMVFVMATIVAIFFFFIDQVLSILVEMLLSL